MSTERRQIEATIAGLEAQRPHLGDTLVDAALAPLRERLAALDAAVGGAPERQALRQVSVPFMDVVGATTLSRRLDPEDVHAVMDGLLARCTARVAAHGGKVLQYAGDSLLAAFGAERAREDDAERAVAAGLAVIDEGARERESVERRFGHRGFGVRVGVHTGEVLLGGGVDADGSIRGITALRRGRDRTARAEPAGHRARRSRPGRRRPGAGDRGHRPGARARTAPRRGQFPQFAVGDGDPAGRRGRRARRLAAPVGDVPRHGRSPGRGGLGDAPRHRAARRR